MQTKTFSPQLEAKITLSKKGILPYKIGPLNLKGRLFLAPLAGITSAPFRLLMQDLGASMTVSELISAKAISYKNERTMKMLTPMKNENDFALQIFGSELDSLITAAQKAQEFNPKFIDLNMGCPVPKVMKSGGGSELLKDISKLPTLFTMLKKSVDIPVTIKIRLGTNSNNLNALEIASLAYDCGISLVFLHGRTTVQKYTGEANWEMIEDIAQNSKIPIIGNGDLNTVIKIKEKLKATNCQALMIGRGALKNPFIFLESQSIDPVNFIKQDVGEIILRFYEYLKEYYYDSPKVQLVQLQKHVIWWAHGYQGSCDFRGQVYQLKDVEKVLELSLNFFTNSANSTNKDLDSLHE